MLSVKEVYYPTRQQNHKKYRTILVINIFGFRYSINEIINNIKLIILAYLGFWALNVVLVKIFA